MHQQDQRARGESNIAELVADQISRRPQRVAIRHGAEVTTYAELGAQAARFASLLRSHGVRPGDRIGLAATRGAPQLVALLAALSTGASYVPLDPALPRERLRVMAAIARPRLIVHDAGTAFDALGEIVDAGLIRTPDLRDPVPAAHAALAISGDTTEAYVLFTSGSTGVPKGVSMPHRALRNLITWQAGASLVGEGDATLQFAPLGFDVSFQEIFSTWATAGELVLIDEPDRRDPARLLAIAAAGQVRRLFLPFAALQSLAEWAANDPGPRLTLDEIIVAGEQPVITPAVERFIETTGHPALINQYGPTETHVVTQHVLTGPPDDWPRLPPIGTPINDCAVHLLDDDLRPVPAGATGEIVITGAAVANGYVSDAAMTAARFISLAHLGAGRGYRTGDFATLSDGILSYAGRRDDQIKISGYRVEIGEVEATIAQLPGVAHVAVVPVGEQPTSRRLVAFVAARRDMTVDGNAIIAGCARMLPPYAVPRSCHVVDTLPHGATGKIDRRALAATLTAQSDPTGPSGDTVIDRVRAVWRAVLGSAEVPVDADFFALGGDSLGAVRLVVALNASFHVHATIGDFLRAPTVTGCVRLLAGLAMAPMFYPPLAKATDQDRVGVSGTQSHRLDREAWRARNGLTSTSNVPMAYRLSGPLDVTALEQALDRVAVTHPLLTAELSDCDGQPRLRLTDRRPTLRIRDAQSLPHALNILQEEAERPIARSGSDHRGLLEACLIRLSASEHLLLLNADHIVFDGWSVGVLNETLSAHYNGSRQGHDPALPPETRFLDWIATEESWLNNTLAALLREDWPGPDLAETLLFPTAYGGNPADVAREQRLRTTLDTTDTGSLRGLCRATGMPFGTVISALFSAAYAQWSGRDEIAMIATYANRTVPNATKSIGFYANQIPVPMNRTGELSIGDLIERGAQEVAWAAQREAVPLPFWRDALLPGCDDLAGYPRYAFLNVRGSDRSGTSVPTLAGLTATPVGIDIALTPSFALGLRAADTGERIGLEIAYLPALVPADRVVELMAGLVALVSRAGDPRVPVSTAVPGGRS